MTNKIVHYLFGEIYYGDLYVKPDNTKPYGFSCYADQDYKHELEDWVDGVQVQVQSFSLIIKIEIPKNIDVPMKIVKDSWYTTTMGILVPIIIIVKNIIW